MMKRAAKQFLCGCASVLVLIAACGTMALATPKSGLTLTFTHGHDNSRHTAYAITQKSSHTDTTYIGAKVVLNYSNGKKFETPQEIGSAYYVRAETPKQHSKKGTSFCYYYKNGTQVHQSTAAKSFNWWF